MTHSEVSELLATFALDAVGTMESLQIEEHLAECPRCRAELDAHREVAAALGNSVEPLPEGLWEGIASRLPERSDAEPPPMPRLVPATDHEKGKDAAAVVHPLRARRHRGRIAALGAIAVGAAAAASVLGINLVRTDDQMSKLQSAISSSAPTAVETALETPGHKVIRMYGTNHHELAQFVLEPEGRGYLISSSLPGLSSNQTYQLWAIVGNEPISIGLLGQSPYMSTFTLAGPDGLSRLGITVEPAGGSVVPSSPMVASGAV
jgi:anti-sigma-K factor RskA/putative zinc finger protein